MPDNESCGLGILQTPRNSLLVGRQLSCEGLKSGILSDLAAGNGVGVGYKFLGITMLKLSYTKQASATGGDEGFLKTISEWWLSQNIISQLWILAKK